MADISEFKKEDGSLDHEKIAQVRSEKPLVPLVTSKRFKEFSVKVNRERMETFPNRLPTMGLLPLPVDEHEHIGMYENMQTVYLTLANAYNVAIERIEQLEEEVAKLKG